MSRTQNHHTIQRTHEITSLSASQKHEQTSLGLGTHRVPPALIGGPTYPGLTPFQRLRHEVDVEIECHGHDGLVDDHYSLLGR